jgi:hypothetical protein
LLYLTTNIQVNISRKIRLVGLVASMVEGRVAYKVLMGKPKGNRQLERPRLRWEDNIKIGLQEVGCGGRDWIDHTSGYRQVAGTCECGNEPSGYVNCGEFLD